MTDSTFHDVVSASRRFTSSNKMNDKYVRIQNEVAIAYLSYRVIRQENYTTSSISNTLGSVDPGTSRNVSVKTRDLSLDREKQC
jgi:hypothetical protein